MQTGISLDYSRRWHMHTLMHTTHTRAHTPTRVGCTSTTQNHTCLFVCAHSYDTPTCMYTPLSAHTCAHIPSTHMHTLVHIHSICMHTCAHTLNHTQPKSSKAPMSRRCHLHSLWPQHSRDLPVVTGEGTKVQTKHDCSLLQCPGSGGGGAAGGHRTHVPSTERPQGPPSGSCSGLGAPGLLQHSSACQTVYPPWKSETPNLGSLEDWGH